MKTWIYISVALFVANTISIDDSACINPSPIDLRDDQWSASTEYGSYTAQEGNVNGVGWRASTYDKFQYLKIDLNGTWQITGILFSQLTNYWYTKTLRVLYSENNFEWIPCNSRLSSNVFGEEFDRTGAETNITFDPVIEARYIIFNPTLYNGRPSLKVELYGCHLQDETKSVTYFSIDVETNTAWIPSQSPVIINKTIEIMPSVTLEIHAGVSVIFTKPDAGIHVFGSLVTKGIPGLTAMFSSDYPVTSFKNKWKGIEVEPGGTLNIAHSVIRQGDICVQGTSEDMDINFGTFYSCNTALRVSEGINLTVTKEEFIPETTFKIRNSEFIYNQYGIQFQGTTEKSSLFIKKCNISLSSGYGIHIGNWYNRALNDVFSRFYIDMSSIERNSNHGIYSGSTGRASIFVNNTIIKGHTGSIGIYSYRPYRRYASSYTENITIMNSELSNNRLQSVYMDCYYCYFSVLTIINTTFESNFDRSSVEVYHSGEVSISIIGNSFHNCRGWYPVIGLSKVGHQSDLEVFGNTFRNSYAVISVNGPDSIMPINIQGNVFMNNTKVSSNSKTSLITISNARLNFTRNSVQSCLMYSLVDIKDGVEHIFSQNKFIDNLLTPCYIKVESIFNRTHAISASYNFWGETDTDTIKSKICDFFVDSRVALVTVEQFYIDITMLSTLNISNAFEFIQQSDENVYIIEGIFDSSVPLLFPEDSTFIVNRSILIAENGDVQISKASFNFSQDRGMRSYGKLEITNSELQGRDLKWTGFHIYEKGLHLKNVTLRDAEMCIEVLESCDVNIDSITVWNTDNFLVADELIGELDIYFRNSNITVNNEMLKVEFRKSNSIVIRDDNSIFSSNTGKIFEISELQTQDRITNISFDLFGSNLNSYGTYTLYNYYQININSCSGPYLGSRNFSDIQNEEPPFISITGEVGGRVNGELTLKADRSPYRVTANIEVGEFDTLTLDPGVTLLFNKDFGINVVGTLIVNGSTVMPVMMLESVYGEAWRGIDINTAEGLFVSIHLCIRERESIFYYQ
ncbi:uncharacterized protein LOC143062058 [Mytilus galloprovincialis]|uniref:uncharacterized protein LOC143062058 n=1 Tax=Mytilus galloprovincialis TaxID=29158 RepID=UPI003F7C756B